MFSSKGTNPTIKNKFPVYHDIRAIGVGSNVLYLTVQCPKCHFTTVHDISLQGPKAQEILNNNTPIDLEALKYFNHTETELFGRTCMLSRTGYSGEKGYELFVLGKDAPSIWDSLLEEGSQLGIMPASFTALDKARIEAGLLFYGYDMTNEHSPWEVNLQWTMSKNKTGYRGYDSAMNIKDKASFKNVGFIINHKIII